MKITGSLRSAKTFFKNWMLPIAMAAGALSYVGYHYCGFLHPAGPALAGFVSVIQPFLIFLMLFLTFCRIEPKEMRPHRWHMRLLAFQCLSFLVFAAGAMMIPANCDSRILLECAMICLICPTATAAAVVTGKLGGDMPGLTAYTVIINIAAAVLIPLFVPFVHPSDGISFITASSLILAKVFPLLIAPCLLAFLVRYLMPKFHKRVLRFGNLAFYLWGISLTLAIAMTTRSIVHSTTPVVYQAGLAAVSLLCCALQFWAGKKIGKRYGASITAGQALGQKNTVFAIWMGYTFLTPVTSIAGGFYCIWHNVFNSWQLYKVSKK